MNYDETKKMHYDPNLINKQEKDGVPRGFFGYDYRKLQKDPDWKPDESKAISMIMLPGHYHNVLVYADARFASASRQNRYCCVLDLPHATCRLR